MVTRDDTLFNARFYQRFDSYRCGIVSSPELCQAIKEQNAHCSMDSNLTNVDYLRHIGSGVSGHNPPEEGGSSRVPEEG